MADVVLNILSLGIKPLYERQLRFHEVISEFRNRLSELEEVSLTQEEIDVFFLKLNSFNFGFTLFAAYYQKYIDNLNRFKPEAKEELLDLTFLMIALAEDKWKPTTPFQVLTYHVKYRYRLTSRFFISHQKKQNYKKLNAPDAIAKQNSKFDSSKKWTRVPIGRDPCKAGCDCSK